jgi:hypothetical protein
MDEPADAGAVASSTSSSSLSSPDEDAFQDQLAGHGALAPPPAADVAVAQPVPRWRLWATTARAGAPWLREACENPARDLVAWTRRGGAPRSLLVVLVSRCDQSTGPAASTTHERRAVVFDSHDRILHAVRFFLIGCMLCVL